VADGSILAFGRQFAVGRWPRDVRPGTLIASAANLEENEFQVCGRGDRRLGVAEVPLLKMIRDGIGGVFRDARGSTMTEYALIATIVSLAILAGLTSMSSTMSSMFNSIASGF
jgi:Flp pilus assembly pilin Flp